MERDKMKLRIRIYGLILLGFGMIMFCYSITTLYSDGMEVWLNNLILVIWGLLSIIFIYFLFKTILEWILNRIPCD